MPTVAKAQMVDVLEERLRRSKGFVFTNFAGLTALEMSDLRRELHQQGLEYLVVKNTLAQRAAQRLGIAGTEGYFRGPTGLCIGYDDATRVFKAVKELTRRYEKCKIKGGVLEGKAVSAQEATELANLPGRQELLAMLASTLQAPIQQLAGTLNALVQNLVSVLEEVRKQRQ